MTAPGNKFSGIINRVIAEISQEEARALHLWATKLLALRYTSKSRKEKFKQIIRLTMDAPVLFPIIRKIAIELKKTGWDDASWKSRLGTGLTFWATLAIANAGAGIALLGGAIAVPLWIVFGSGDEFVKRLIQTLRK